VILVSVAQAMKPESMDWIGTSSMITCSVVTSAAASYVLAFQFHKAVKASRGEASKKRLWKDWRIISSVILFLLHITLFVVSGALLAVQRVQAQNSFFRLGFLVSFAFVLYKVFISVYFFWGHWQVYRVFKATGSSAKTGGSASSMIAKRLGLISVTNFLGLIIIMMYSLPSIGYYGHGWVCMVWGAIMNAITTLLEVEAIPSADSTKQATSADNQPHSASMRNVSLRKTESQLHVSQTSTKQSI
jgi:hypothetical protein